MADRHPSTWTTTEWCLIIGHFAALFYMLVVCLGAVQFALVQWVAS